MTGRGFRQRARVVYGPSATELTIATDKEDNSGLSLLDSEWLSQSECRICDNPLVDLYKYIIVIIIRQISYLFIYL